MRYPTFRFVTIGIAAVLLLAACGSTTAAPPAKVIKVGLVTDIGGLNDKSFNHLAAIGLTNAAGTGSICSSLTCKNQLGVQGDVVESHTGDDYVPNLTNFATKNYDLVIGVGFLMQQAIGTVSGLFPNVHFAIIDGAGTDASFNDLHHSNVESLLFREQDAGAMVGVIAGMLEKTGATPNKTNVIGAVGGISIPPVDRYIAGYAWGAQMEDPTITVYDFYSNDFTDPAKCSGKASAEIGLHAEILFQVAGGCGLGVLKAAGDAHLYSIGVDADQKDANPSVIASALKKVDVATYTAIKSVKDGTFTAGVLTFSIANDGAGYAVDNLTLPADVQAEVTKVAAQIKAGTLTPPAAIPAFVKK